MMLHQEKKKGLIILVEIGVFVLRRKKKWGNGLALAATTKLHRYLKMKKIEIMLGNGLSMMLESEILSIELIINFLDNREDQLLVIIF